MVSRPSSSHDGCGEIMALACTTNPVENLFTPTTITWIAPNGREVPTGGSSNPRIDTQTRYLIFNGITTTNRGAYKCRAVVNIPEAQIVNHFDEATATVNTNRGLSCLLLPLGTCTCTYNSPWCGSEHDLCQKLFTIRTNSLLGVASNVRK